MGLLRTILAIVVVLDHSPWHYGFGVGGRYAVELFYMISGFLIAHVIANNETYKNPVKFYLNRALRLYPIYYAVIVLTILTIPLNNQNFFEIYRNIPFAADALLVISNIFIFGQDWVMFSGVDNGSLVFAANYKQSDFVLYHGLLAPQAWTLGVELCFYALAPFILRDKRIVFLMLFLSLSIRILLFSIGIGNNDPWNYRFFPAELLFFLAGSLSNQYLLPLWRGYISSNQLEQLPTAGTFLITAFIVLFYFIPVSGSYKAPILFILFLVFLPLTFLHQNASKGDKFIGELSYPIYVCHLLVVMTISTLNLGSDFIISLGNVSISILLAYFLNKYVGRRVEGVRSIIKAGKPISNVA